jgi:hypothetical protein
MVEYLIGGYALLPQILAEGLIRQSRRQPSPKIGAQMTVLSHVESKGKRQ